MPAPSDFEKAGTYLFLFFLCIFGTIIGIIKGISCGSFPCFYIFLGAGILFLMLAIQHIFFV
jgi:hypothetical protein